MKSSGGYYVIVIEDLNCKKVIGSATLVVEQKFIHNCALVSIKFSQNSYEIIISLNLIFNSYETMQSILNNRYSKINYVATYINL